MTMKYLQIPQKVQTILSQEKCEFASKAETANKPGIYKICVIIFTLLYIVLLCLLLPFKNFNHIKGKIVEHLFVDFVLVVVLMSA